MTSPRSIIVAGLVAVLGAGSALALTACSEDDIFGGDDGQVSVKVTERDLDPARVEVDAGRIEFEVHNEGDRVHEFAVQIEDGVARLDDIKPGDSDTLSVDLSPGRYRMYDPRGGYRKRGVSGTVVVRSDDSRTVTERTVERTVEEQPAPAPETDEPEVQEPEVQEPPPAQPAPPPVVTQTVVKPAPPPPPAETTP